MQSEQSTFFTQIRQRRPKTSHITRNKHSLRQSFAIDPDLDAALKIKTYKDEIKKLEQEYTYALANYNQSRKHIDRQYRQSQKKKVQFINLYQNRKLKLLQQKLLEEKQRRDQQNQSGLRERAKTLKLNSEVRALLTRNQIEENNSQICSKNRFQKTKTRQQLSRNRDRLQDEAKRSFSRIKNEESGLLDRRKKIASMQASAAKQNYLRKLEGQLKQIDCYDKLLNQMCDDGTFCQTCTADKQHSFFITDKRGSSGREFVQ